jgi:hypothetical protein
MKYFLAIVFMVFTILTATSHFAKADDTAAVVSQTQVSGLQNAVDKLKEVESKVPTSIPAWLLTVVTFAVGDIGARLYPTAKPKSLFLLIGAALAMVGSIFTKLSGLLDGLAQNLKE